MRLEIKAWARASCCCWANGPPRSRVTVVTSWRQRKAVGIAKRFGRNMCAQLYSHYNAIIASCSGGGGSNRFATSNQTGVRAGYEPCSWITQFKRCQGLASNSRKMTAYPKRPHSCSRRVLVALLLLLLISRINCIRFLHLDNSLAHSDSYLQQQRRHTHTHTYTQKDKPHIYVHAVLNACCMQHECAHPEKGCWIDLWHAH